LDNEYEAYGNVRHIVSNAACGVCVSTLVAKNSRSNYGQILDHLT